MRKQTFLNIIALNFLHLATCFLGKSRKQRFIQWRQQHLVRIKCISLGTPCIQEFKTEIEATIVMHQSLNCYIHLRLCSAARP